MSSSTTWWIMGWRPTGNISLGIALVVGSRRVPKPATGTTALVIRINYSVLIMEWGNMMGGRIFDKHPRRRYHTSLSVRKRRRK
jgi:hypothetical protein